MAEARGRSMWVHTSTILAMVANVNRDPKKTKAFGPKDFDPYAVPAKKESEVITDMGDLKSMFTKA